MKKTLLSIILTLFFITLSFAQDNVERTYYDSGELKCEYPPKNKNNLPNGLVKCYYKNGTLQHIGTLKDGKIDGIGKIYDENGHIYQEIPFKEGNIDGVEKYYFDNGDIMKEIPYKNNQKDGIAKIYYKNGAIQYEITFKNDQANGIEKLYSESGKLQQEITYKKNQINGIVKRYNNGNLWATIMYNNDKPISGTCANGRKWTNIEISNWEKGLKVICD